MFLPEDYTSPKTHSEEKAAQIDVEATRLVEEAHQRVQGILSERRSVLDDLAHLLSQKEIVQGPELREMLSKSTSKALSLRPETERSF
jgi:cell division protease FtsH